MRNNSRYAAMSRPQSQKVVIFQSGSQYPSVGIKSASVAQRAIRTSAQTAVGSAASCCLLVATFAAPLALSLAVLNHVERAIVHLHQIPSSAWIAVCLDGNERGHNLTCLTFKTHFQKSLIKIVAAGLKRPATLFV
jgi:hypothetical protein